MFPKMKQLLRSSTIVYKSVRRFRNRYYRWRYGLINVHPTTYVSPGSRISRDLVVHEYAFISDGCRIGPGVELGRYVMLGPRVAIVGADHRYDLSGTPMIFSGRPEVPKTIVETDVWIGYGAVVMAGARIGHGSIVAAGAVVTRDIPPYEIWGGVPAHKIRDRFTSTEEREEHDRMLGSPPREGAYAQFSF
jgi:acetyltransferase-like isoleucine patch superfamily enzyme